MKIVDLLMRMAMAIFGVILVIVGLYVVNPGLALVAFGVLMVWSVSEK